jgi:hypothetical protein
MGGYKSLVLQEFCNLEELIHAHKLFMLDNRVLDGMTVERIESNEYFNSVKEYFADHKVPARVYKFLMDTLQEDEYKLSDDLLYQSVDTLETTEDCFRFCVGTECILVLCSEPRK